MSNKIEYKFSEDFIWGTSTASAQIESPSDHEWNGLEALDGSIFNETIRHEKYLETDAEFISELGDSYRLSLDWAKLQTAPLAPFDMAQVEVYRTFIKSLRDKGLSIMLVCHHFTNPTWFAEKGHWLDEDCIVFFLDYVKQLLQSFGDLVDYWNTFNEPMVYIGNAFLLGNFPPFEKSLSKTYRVLKNIVQAHQSAYTLIKKNSTAAIGISKNSVSFYPRNLLGYIPSKICDYAFNSYGLAQFESHLDFIGLSYYARIGLGPLPLTYIDQPEVFEKEEIPHDMMWEYAPDDFEKIIRKVWSLYRKPIIITENGIATESSSQRIASMKDYLKIFHKLISEGVDIQGYYHWSTFDNFEWHLGRSYKFGLVSVDRESYERKIKDCGLFYKQLRMSNGF